MNTLIPRYKNTERIAAAIMAIEYWGDFFGFIEPFIARIDDRRAQRKREVASLMLAIDNPELDPDHLMQPTGDKGSDALLKDRENLEHVLGSMVKKENITVDIASWKRWHRKVFKASEGDTAGKFRENELPVEKGKKVTDVPKGEELNDYIERLHHFVKEADMHPVIKSWIALYFIYSILPFHKRNAVIGLLVARGVLYNSKAIMGHFLLCEKRLREEQGLIEKTWETILFSNNFMFKLEADLTGYLENALELHVKSCEDAAEYLESAYKETISYNTLSLKEQNEIEYLFNRFYPRTFDKVRQLNLRQKKLLHYAAIKGGYTAKEMNLRLRVDRKTIQRDSKELVEAGLIKAYGKGRSVSYGLAR